MSAPAPVPASSLWFYLVDDNQVGPVARDQLIKLVDKGILQPDTLVWREGLKDWVEARRVSFLPFQRAVAIETIASVQPVNARLSSREESEEDDEDLPREKKRKKKKKLKLETASAWKRLVGAVADHVIIVFLVFVVGFLVGFFCGALRIDIKNYVEGLVYLIYFSVFITYFTLMDSSGSSGTLGKLAAGTKVVNLDGDPLTLVQGFVRALVRLPSVMLLGIGCLLGLANAQLRTLQDMAAGSRVVMRD